MKTIYVYFKPNTTTVLAVTHTKTGAVNTKTFTTGAAALVWMRKQGVHWEWTTFPDGAETAYGCKR